MRRCYFTWNTKPVAIISKQSSKSKKRDVINRFYDTQEIFKLDGGQWIGEIGLSKTSTIVDAETEGLYKFKDINNQNVITTGFGANNDFHGGSVWEAGYSTEGHLYIDNQGTPWTHSSISLGLDGVGYTVGIIVGDTSYDLDIRIGWGSIVAVALAIVTHLRR